MIIEEGHISGDGSFTLKCQELISNVIQSPKVLLTTSCTHALEMSAMLLDISQGDEIIVPSFTFVTSANSFVVNGAKPIFVDIRQDTLNIDESLIESKINKRTKAIVVVHYAGVACELDSILHLGEKYSIPIIEDNALGLFGKYKNKYLGTFGTFATQSFHETKSYSCGEGGALIINDSNYFSRAEIIREKGTNRKQYLDGTVDKYTWVDYGSSYLPSDLNAAFLYPSLSLWETIQIKRKSIWEYYFDKLTDWSKKNNIEIPQIPSYCEQAYSLFYLILNSKNQRELLMKYLRENGIETASHYIPLHTSKMGKIFGYKVGELPITEKISKTLLRLPFYTSISKSQQDRVIRLLHNYNF